MKNKQNLSDSKGILLVLTHVYGGVFCACYLLLILHFKDFQCQRRTSMICLNVKIRLLTLCAEEGVSGYLAGFWLQDLYGVVTLCLYLSFM